MSEEIKRQTQIIICDMLQDLNKAGYEVDNLFINVNNWSDIMTNISTNVDRHVSLSFTLRNKNECKK